MEGFVCDGGDVKNEQAGVIHNSSCVTSGQDLPQYLPKVQVKWVKIYLIYSGIRGHRKGLGTA